MNRQLSKLFVVLVLMVLLPTFPTQQTQAQTVLPDIVISQVYGGGGNSGAPFRNDFVELFNRGTNTVSLAGWSLQYASATGTGTFDGNPIALLSGALAPEQYYLIQLGSGGTNGVTLPAYDATTGTNMSGTAGKVALVNTTTGLACNGASTPCSSAQLAQIVDFVGYGNTNFFEGSGAAPTLSNTTAAFRASSGCIDTDNNAVDFTADVPAPRNTASPLHSCPADVAPTVSSTYPSDDSTNVPIDANLTVTFSEPVHISDTWYTLTCSVSGSHAAVVSGGPTTFTLSPTTAFVSGEHCTLTILADHVSDQDVNDPPDRMMSNFVVDFSPVDVCVLPYTPIYAIQGSGEVAASTGPVTTQGVVVGDYEGPAPALRGFYLQDPTGDGDAATSDGIFVFNGNNNSVNLGEVVRVTGNVEEFEGQTEIVSVAPIAHCGTGSVTPVDVSLPFPSADYAERYEGMLVRLHQTLYVTEHFQLGRFGQVVMSSGGRLDQPTNVTTPGAAAQALQGANDLNRIIIDDPLNNQNSDPILFGRSGQPLSASNTLRGGDTATDIVGVMTYTWAGDAASGNAYRVRPVNALGGSINFVAANPRPLVAPDVGGTLKIVGMNLLNFFNTFANCTNGTGGAATDCRGADTQAEFDRQWPKTVAAIRAMDPDILGVNELENDGYGPTSAIQFLVDRLNAATASGTYAFIDVDANTGQVNALGTDAIKVALLYKPAAVTPVGQTAVLNTEAFVNGGDSAPRSRPSLAQAFEQNANGQRFIVVVNHLKSKGSACDAPDAGDGQGNCNAVRVKAAQELISWLASNPTGTGDSDVLLIGDYNSYAMEDPITVITNAGFTNLIATFVGPGAYSYAFDGQWGYLDYAFASASLRPQVTGVGEYHINADEPNVLDYNTDFKSAGQLSSLYNQDPFRISDHDPVLVGLCLPPMLHVRVSPQTLWPPNRPYVTVEAVFTASNDTISVTLVSVTSNAPNTGLKNNDTAPDMIIVDNQTVKLWAERSRHGTGRVYTLTYQATNVCGNTVMATATVTVPRNQ